MNHPTFGGKSLRRSLAIASLSGLGLLSLSRPALAQPPSSDGFYTLTPCRVLDTRNPNGAWGGPAMAANVGRAFQFGGRCGIPTSANAVAVNVTIASATTAGSVRMYPTGSPVPNSSALNYKAASVRANNGNHTLSSSGSMTVRCDQASGVAHLIIDVFGYYETQSTPPPTGSGPHIWSRDFGGPQAGVDSAAPAGIAVDGSGASVVVAYLKGKADFGGGLLTSAGSGDVVLAKYSASGSLLWAQRFGGTLDDRPKDVALDAAGNIFITGFFRGTSAFGGAQLTATTGSSNGFLAKYSPSGAHIWSKRLTSGNTSIDTGIGLGVDAGGSVIVGASLYGGADFGGGVLYSVGFEDVVLAKYSSTGGHVWSRRMGGTASDWVTRVAVDATSGDVVASGYFAGSANFGGQAFTSAGANDAFIVKYSSSGAHVWSRRWGSSAEDKAFGVAVDGQGNVAVTGQFSYGVDFGGGTIANQGDASSSDIFLVKLSSAGGHVWSKGFGSSLSLGEMGYGVAFDDANSVVLTGGVVATVNFGGTSLTGDGYYNAFLAKFGSSGAHVWSKRYSGGGNHSAGRAVSTDSGGNVLAVGDFEGSINLGGGSMTSPGITDTFLVKLGP